MLVRKILITAIGAAMAAGSSLLAAPAGAQVQPAPSVTFKVSTDALSAYQGIDVYVGEIHAGAGFFSQDPGGDLDGDGSSDPGDAIIAYDAAPDGYGIETHLSTGRKASTQGHPFPYWSAWATGDLPEGNTYTMEVCVIGDGSGGVCKSRTVTA
jgi:hypothetical protein